MRNERYASGSWCYAWFGLLSAVSFLRWCKLTTGGRIFQEEIAYVNQGENEYVTQDETTFIDQTGEVLVEQTNTAMDPNESGTTLHQPYPAYHGYAITATQNTHREYRRSASFTDGSF